MLYFGSFNPVHRGHIALAEYVLARGLCDEAVLVISPQSPYKTDRTMAPELARFEMAELACKGSAAPGRILPSAVEFLLPRPSYTIDTLRYLEAEHGQGRTYSILMGADQLDRLDGWKEYERLFDYPIFVYPRRGEPTGRFRDRITLLDDAPLLDISSTEIRRRLEAGEPTEGMLDPDVAAYIRREGLWRPQPHKAETKAETGAGAGAETETEALLARGREHYRRCEWGAALNAFNEVLRSDPGHTEAGEYARLIQEILEFRYKDIYNP